MELNVNSAWDLKRYDLVLSLVKKDENFPKKFNLEKLNGDDDIQKSLIEFAERRNSFHEWISKGDEDNFKKVKNFTLEEKSIYYLNVRNETAALTALTEEKFRIYAYFVSIGVNLKKHEERELEKLGENEKYELQEVMHSYFPKSDKSHIYYLRSKIKSKNSFEKNEERLFEYLEQLNRIKDVAIILKVIQYVDNLDLVIDLDKENVGSVCITSNGDIGITFSERREIYIAAGGKRSNKETLGTLAHELTHMAMHLVFDNNRNPYLKTNQEMKAEFQKLTSSTLNHITSNPSQDRPFEILAGAFTSHYIKHKQEECELIARVPQILAELTSGKKWLEKNAAELFKFYQKKVTPECEKFIEKSFLLKPKSFNRSMNENEGEIISIKKCGLVFKDNEKIKNFFNTKNKKVFALITEFTWIGLLRALQGLYGIYYVDCYDRFLVFKLKQLVKNIEEITTLFCSEATETIIIECPYITESDDKATIPAIKQIIEIVEEKDKKIIFILKDEDSEKIIVEILEEYDLSDDFARKKDEDVSVYDLNEESQLKILNTQVLFQEKKIKLGNLICKDEDTWKCLNREITQEILSNKEVQVGSKLKIRNSEKVKDPYIINKDTISKLQNNSDSSKTQENKLKLRNLINEGEDEDMLKCLDGEIMQELLSNKEIRIGRKPFGISSLEGAYGDIGLEANLESIIWEIESTKNIFVISCENISNPETDVQKCLGEDIDASLIAKLKNLEHKISNSKRIFLIDDDVNDNESDKFMRFCNLNPEKKIYLLKLRDGCIFFLLKFYNPDFYFKRKFRIYEKVVVKKNILEKISSEKVEDLFIIGKESDIELRNNSYSPNIRLVDLNEMYENNTTFRESKQATHFLKYDNDRLVWQESLNSLSGLRPWIDPDLSEEKLVTDENKLKSEIMQEEVVILADEPGMGKTTSLTEFYNDDELFNNYWVVRINLRNHLKAIKSMKLHVYDVKQVINFLIEVDSELKSSITKEFLSAALGKNKKFNRDLLLCFDGFDELLDDDHREKVLKLLIFLKNKTRCKIWITTRLHYKEYLENGLLVFSIKFEPIRNQLKKDFIKNYMNGRLKLILSREKYDEVFGESEKFQNESKLENYTKKLLNKAKEIFKDNIENFIGTPLQLHLLLEGSLPLFKNHIENSEDIDFSYLGNNLMEVYEKYVDRKCEIYFRKKNVFEEKSKKMHKKNFHLWHEQLADSLVKNESLEDEFMENKSMLLLIGITKDEGENIQFVHFTFREFFYVRFLIRIIGGKEKGQEFYHLFIEEISVEEKYQMIRNFINACLQSTENEEQFKRRELGFLSVLSLKFSKAYAVAIEESNNHLLHFFFSLNLGRDTVNSILDKNFHFSLAIKTKNDSALDQIIELASKYNVDLPLFAVVDETFGRAFELALWQGNNFAISRIIELAEKNGSDLSLVVPALTYQDPVLHLAMMMRNEFAFNRIIKIAKKYDLVRSLLVCPYEHTLLELATTCYLDSAFNRIIELASKYNLHQKLLTDVNDQKEIAFHCAVYVKNNFAFNGIIELASKYNLQQHLLTAVDRKGNTAFHLAVREQNDFAFNRIVELASKYNRHQQLLTSTGEYGNAAFHLAVIKKNDFAVNKIIELASKYNRHQRLLTAVNDNKETAFHVAVTRQYDFALQRIDKLATKYYLNLILTSSLLIKRLETFTDWKNAARDRP